VIRNQILDLGFSKVLTQNVFHKGRQGCGAQGQHYRPKVPSKVRPDMTAAGLNVSFILDF